MKTAPAKWRYFLVNQVRVAGFCMTAIQTSREMLNRTLGGAAFAILGGTPACSKYPSFSQGPAILCGLSGWGVAHCRR
jgi:hypothetical protein